MSKFRIQRFTQSITLPIQNDTELSTALTGPVNGILKGIIAVAPAITGSSWTLKVLGNRGETLFSKASLSGGANNVVLYDSNNRPLEVPLVIDTGVQLFEVSTQGTPDGTGSLTFDDAGPITDGETVTVGVQVYRFKDTLAAAYDVLIEPDVAASGTITSDTTNPDAGGVVTVDDQEYTFASSLTEAYATGVVTATSNGIPTEDDTIVVGDRTYRFRDTLAQVDDVKIGADGEATLNNLRATLDLSGTEGVEYFAGQVANTEVNAPSAAAVDGDATLGLQALVLGVAGNSYVLTESAANITVSGSGTLAGGVDAVANEVLIGGSSDATLTNLKNAANGGTGEGTTYSTGTSQPSTALTVTGPTANALTVTADTAGTSGNSIVLTETATHITVSGSGTLANGAWSGEATLQNLSDAIELEDGSGESGVKYHADTPSNDSVNAADAAANVMGVTALAAIDDATEIATATDAATLSWGAVNLVGGGEAAERTFSVDLLIERG